MTVTRRFDAGSTARLFAILMAAALMLAVLPLAGTAGAQDADGDYNGEVIEQGPDAEEGRIASTRFRGEQRFATAALIGAETWEQSERAVIARHDDWPDALAGGYLAGVFEAPVLLVSQNNLQDDTLTALEELGVTDVTLLGGTRAISAENETALETEHGYNVDRIGGETRFETAAEVATEGGVVGQIEDDNTAIVATGIEFADALTMGPMAYAGQFPILLTPSQSLHPATAQALDDLEIDRVLLAGGTSAISEEVEDDIREAIEGDEDSVQRLRGETRVETAIDAAEFALSTPGLAFTTLEHGWARGNEFADALTVGPRMGQLRAPLLLVPTPNRADSGAGSNQEFAEAHACETNRIDLAGGFAAISEDVENELRGWYACPGEALNVMLMAEPESTEMGEDIDVTVTVTDNLGAAVEGAEVDLTAESDSAMPVFADATVTTDADGMATTTVSSDTPGEALLIGTHIREDEVEVSGDTVVEWTLPGQTSAFLIELSSENEVGDDTAVDEEPPVTGRALLFLNSDTGDYCWGIRMDPAAEDQEIGSYEGFGAVNSHVHVGEAGVAGGVILPLGQVQDDTLMTAGCDTAGDPSDVADVEDDAAGHYVNVHTDVYTAGVARGQLAEADAEE